MQQRPGKIAVIGGGITGLAAAQRLLEHAPSAEITLFEAADRLGGMIQTTHRDGFLIEHGADSFMVSDQMPWAGELCQRIGLELIPTEPRHRGALVLRGRQFHPVPDGLHLMSIHRWGPLLASPLLSWRGKLRVACEPFVPRRRDPREESLADFATRRLGREMFERIVQPLVAGIYSADPDNLSVAAALPRFAAMEQQYGSLFRAEISRKKSTPHTSSERGARYSLFRTPAHGIQALIDTLVRQLPGLHLRTGAPIQGLTQSSDHRWALTQGDGTSDSFDALILATSALAAAELLQPVEPELAQLVQSIVHASAVVVCLGYRREQVAHPLDAFGCVIPAIEGRRILAVSFSHRKFPGRAPPGHVLLRVFVGGALREELTELPDADLTCLAREEVAELLGVKGKPSVQQIMRWPRATPQYHLGHLTRMRQIERLVQRYPNLALGGNAYGGVGIPQCIRSGWAAAERILGAKREIFLLDQRQPL